MKPVPPELRHKLQAVAEPETLTPQQIRFAEMKLVAARRREAGVQIKPEAHKQYDPHNAVVLTPDLFGKATPEQYSRTDNAFPANLRPDGKGLDNFATATPEQALAEKTNDIRAQKKAKYANPTPVDAFGSNPTPATRRFPNGEKQEVVLTQGESQGYKFSARPKEIRITHSEPGVYETSRLVDGTEAILSLNNTAKRVQPKWKNKIDAPDTSTLRGLEGDWDRQIGSALKGRMHKLAESADKEPGLAHSFRKLVQGAANIVRKKKDNFVDNVTASTDAIAGGPAK